MLCKEKEGGYELEFSVDFIKRVQAIVDAFREFAKAVEKIFGQLHEQFEQEQIKNKFFSKTPFHVQKKRYCKKPVNTRRKVPWYTYKYKF